MAIRIVIMIINTHGVLFTAKLIELYLIAIPIGSLPPSNIFSTIYTIYI